MYFDPANSYPVARWAVARAWADMLLVGGTVLAGLGAVLWLASPFPLVGKLVAWCGLLGLLAGVWFHHRADKWMRVLMTLWACDRGRAYRRADWMLRMMYR